MAKSSQYSSQGWQRLVKATKYSIQGFSAAWKEEAAFRQELYLTGALLPVALWIGDGAVERILLIGSCVLVLIVEIINSAIEAVVDRGGQSFNSLAGRAKDLGSAAVALTICLAAVVWFMMLWDKYLSGF